MRNTKNKTVISIMSIILVMIFSFTFLFGNSMLLSKNIVHATVSQDVDPDDDDGEGEEEDDGFEDEDYGSGNAIIELNVGAHGSVTINGSNNSPQTLTAGEEYTVVITPDNGYEIDTVKVMKDGSLFESLTSSIGGASTSVSRNVKFPAGSDTLSVTFSEPEEQYGDDEPETRKIGYILDTKKSAIDSGTIYQDQDKRMYYCADESLHGPAHSGGHINVKLQTKADKHQKEFDYIMYYGYPKHKKIKGKKYSAKNAHDLTQIAIWMVLDSSYRSSNNPKMNAPAKALVKAAKKYDGKNAKINGTAILYYPKGKKKQPFITVNDGSKLSIKKKASGSEIKGNELYTLENTAFKVYDTKADAENGTDPKKTLTVHNGETDSIELGKEVYYFKETNATPGYKLDKEVVKADLSSGSKSFTAKNDPIVVPFCMLNIKGPNATLGPLSDPYDLTSKFKVEYYDTKSKDVKNLSESSSLAVFDVTSNKQGQVSFDKSSISFTKGKTHFDQFMDGYNGLPLGLYKITETEAPKGFKSNSEPSYFIFDDGTDFDEYNRKIVLWTKNSEKEAFKKTELGGCENISSEVVNIITKKLERIIPDEKYSIGLIAEKRDNDTANKTPQGDVSDFAGIKMQVINNGPKIATFYDNNGHRMATERAVDTGGVIYEGVTDANGVFKVPEILPQAEQARGGTKYTIKEVASKDGYHLNDSWSISVTRYQEEITAETTIDTRTNTDRVVCDNKGAIENAVWRGGIEIEKDDFYLGKSEAINGKDHDATKHEGTDLNGIEFTVWNASSHPVVVPKNIDLSKKGSTAPTNIDYGIKAGENTDQNLQIVQPGDEIGKITTSWDNDKKAYIARTQIDALPYGTYKVKETKTNKYYQLTDTAERIVEVHKDKEYSTKAKTAVNGTNELVWKNKPWRQNVYLKKKMENNDAGSYIPFKITSTSTGEYHYIVTNNNGEYDSSKTPHDQNTNDYDKYIDSCLNNSDPSKRVVDSSQLKAMRTDESGTKSTVPGLWFSKGEDDTDQPVDNELASLPAGGYVLEEIPCTNNKGMEMLKRHFTIAEDEDKVMLNNEALVNLGTLTNHPVHPEISTTAKDKLTGCDLGVVGDEITLVDTVEYSGLQAGEKYKLIGTLHTTDGEVLKIGDHKLTAEKEFDPDPSGKGTVDVEFVFNSNELKGKDTVVYEKLYVLNKETNKYETVKNNGIPVVHEDPDDLGQTVHFPDAGTKAKDSQTNSNVGLAGEKTEIIDTVEYKNLVADKEYTVKGTLMNKETGEPIMENDQPVTAETTFTVKKGEENGTVELKYEVDSSTLAGKTVVVFEDITTIGIKVVSHADINDEQQSIHYPEVGTTAKDSETGTNVGVVGENSKIVDTVHCKNLVFGQEYVISGKLMDKETGEPIKQNGEDITSSAIFTANAEEQDVDVIFVVNSELLRGKSTVVFEDLLVENNVVATHADINDDGQTINYPDAKTQAKDAVSGTNEGTIDEESTIIDTVYYTNLVPGKEYTVKGTLMNKETGEPVKDGDKEITSEAKFTPDEKDGTVEMTFKVKSSLLRGKTVVVFEDILTDRIEVVSHADINDQAQTIDYPDAKTQAEDAVTETNIGKVDKKVKLIDTVNYTNLKPGKEYTVKGTLMNQKTGKPIEVNGNPITSETKFTPENKDGSVKMEFELNSKLLEGTTTVVFEDIFTEFGKVVSHADINDKAQTVQYNKLRTTATVNGKHSVKSVKAVKIIDKVKYSNLVPGKEYTVKGTLMDKKTKKPVKVKGKTITARKTFTPKKSNGTVKLVFKANAKALQGKTTVVFEKLYYNKKLIGAHADIKDKAQTVKFKKTPKPVHTVTPTHSNNSSGSQTGDDFPFWIFFMVGGFLVAAGGAFAVKKYRQ